MKRTLFEKVWEKHVVVEETPENPAVLFIDLHLIHEVTSPQAFTVLNDRGFKVRRPDLTLATLDHSTPTLPPKEDGSLVFVDEQARKQVEALPVNCANHGIELLGVGDRRRGIVHVIGPELGATQPGKTIVCGDSHTSTHGAFGAIAFGIGTTEVGHVLATQCVFQRRPKTMRIVFDGRLKSGVGAKDMALAFIAQIGADGGQGYAIEFSGSAIDDLSMDGRMTLCNMSIEAGARFGMIAPDAKTISWLEGREKVPSGDEWRRCVDEWLSLASDDGAHFDVEVSVDASAIEPMITFGVSPDQAGMIKDVVPDARSDAERDGYHYMAARAGESFAGTAVNKVFIGSCTNSRLSDIREAADIFNGRKVSENVVALIVPGSQAIKRDAENEGLHEIFLAAGAQWREPGCSMCIAMNGDKGEPGDLVVSTSNRNFKGRQGEGVRTVLASPATAAAAAIAGKIIDPRAFMDAGHDDVI